MTRIDKLKGALAGKADAFITFDEKTRLYLTKFSATDGTLFVTGEEANLFVDFRYIEAAEKSACGCKVIMPEGKVSDEVKKLIAERNIKTVGFEEAKLTVAEFDALKNTYPDTEFVPVSGIISQLCEYKDPDEIEKIIAAQKITDETFLSVLSLIKRDMTEIEVAAEIEYQMKKRGATSPSFETIAVSGTNSARPHGVPRNVKLEAGFLTMDFGCVYQGYCSDMTRTIVIGNADAEMKKLYETVLAAQTAAINAAAAGIGCAFLDGVARDIINEAGYRGCFGHGLGHGVGLYIHENPRVSPGGGTKTLALGDVFTVEPGIYLKGKYGARIEDMMIITEKGAIDITKSKKELIELTK